MKLQIEFKVRWWLVALVAASFVTGAGLSAFLVYNQPAMVRCQFTLPNALALPI